MRTVLEKQISSISNLSMCSQLCAGLQRSAVSVHDVVLKHPPAWENGSRGAGGYRVPDSARLLLKRGEKRLQINSRENKAADILSVFHESKLNPALCIEEIEEFHGHLQKQLNEWIILVYQLFPNYFSVG